MGICCYAFDQHWMIIFSSIMCNIYRCCPRGVPKGGQDVPLADCRNLRTIAILLLDLGMHTWVTEFHIFSCSNSHASDLLWNRMSVSKVGLTPSLWIVVNLFPVFLCSCCYYWHYGIITSWLIPPPKRYACSVLVSVCLSASGISQSCERICMKFLSVMPCDK